MELVAKTVQVIDFSTLSILSEDLRVTDYPNQLLVPRGVGRESLL